MATQTLEPPTLDTFAARLAVIRQAQGWNQKEAALACGIPQASWRNWEAGRMPQNLVEVAERISSSTGYPVAWVVFGPAGYEGGTRAVTFRSVGANPPPRHLYAVRGMAA